MIVRRNALQKECLDVWNATATDGKGGLWMRLFSPRLHAGLRDWELRRHRQPKHFVFISVQVRADQRAGENKLRYLAKDWLSGQSGPALNLRSTLQAPMTSTTLRNIIDTQTPHQASLKHPTSTHHDTPEQRRKANMPPTRKARTTSSGHGPAARGSQKTLSFGRRFGSQVSKPSTPAAAKELSSSGAVASASPLGKSVVVALAAPPSPSTAAQDVDVEEQQLLPQGGLVKASEEEARAQKVTDAQVQRYWRAREGERLTRRVHQEGLGVEEKILRWWDVSSQFGVRPFLFSSAPPRWLAGCFSLSPLPSPLSPGPLLPRFLEPPRVSRGGSETEAPRSARAFWRTKKTQQRPADLLASSL